MKSCIPILLAVASLPAVALHGESADYREPWRPRFHFTPERNWMNDPNGMVYHDGEFHLFYQYNPEGDRWGHMSWGHAVSPDLVHWEHLPLALAEQDGVMVFSGSAVVDVANTSGFGRDGRPPLVAIFTGHSTERPHQAQHIAFSNDRGRTWTRYPGNPVLDIGAADFRDPKVFWHEPSGRWVIAVAWPVERKVRFYASPNLRAWTHLSDFGPAGSVSGIWECPDLFPIDGPASGPGRDWILVVNVGSGAPAGGSGCQYFVGTFDGSGFHMDPGVQPVGTEEFVPAGDLVADFEGGDFGGWTAEGNAFAGGPARGAWDGQQVVAGFRGDRLVNSFLGGDETQGTLTSPPFEISRDHLSFLIGGGNHAGRTCLDLMVDGKVVRSATGDASETLRWKSWPVGDLRGRQAVLRIVDRESGGWGHVNVDHILLADTPARSASEPALWADHGRDFYAAVSWSGVPKRDGRRLWLGWMSNWEYAQDVPTHPWRSAMSVPRALSLVRGTDGPRLAQQPVRELSRLAGRRLRPRPVSGGLELRSESGLTDVGFRVRRLGAADRVSVILESALGETVEIVADGPAGELRLDRTRSGETGFHGRFAGIHRAPLRWLDGTLDLRLLIDTGSVEVFAQEGTVVITDLVFPKAPLGIVRIGVSPGSAARVDRVRARELKSAW